MENYTHSPREQMKIIQQAIAANNLALLFPICDRSPYCSCLEGGIPLRYYEGIFFRYNCDDCKKRGGMTTIHREYYKKQPQWEIYTSFKGTDRRTPVSMYLIDHLEEYLLD